MSIVEVNKDCSKSFNMTGALMREAPYNIAKKCIAITLGKSIQNKDINNCGIRNIFLCLE
jgi:hypothetical protein